MSRRSLSLGSVVAASVLAMLYPSLSRAQQPADPSAPSAAPSPAAYPQQQPPPGYYPQQQPPPGYYPQQQPPPGYYPQQQPPPGYYPQQQPSPGYYPQQQPLPPGPAEPPEPAFRRGFLAMPYIGFHIPVGDFGDSYGTGLRLGALLGGHLGPSLSLNGELTIDVLSPKDVPSGIDVTSVMVDVLFSPLFHFRSDAVEGFVGPKLGGFGFVMSASAQGQELKQSAQGLAYGINAGFGIPVGNIAIGGLFSYVGRHATRACYTLPGEPEECDDSPSGDDAHAIAFTGLVLF